MGAWRLSIYRVLVYCLVPTTWSLEKCTAHNYYYIKNGLCMNLDRAWHTE